MQCLRRLYAFVSHRLSSPYDLFAIILYLHVISSILRILVDSHRSFSSLSTYGFHRSKYDRSPQTKSRLQIEAQDYGFFAGLHFFGFHVEWKLIDTGFLFLFCGTESKRDGWLDNQRFSKTQPSTAPLTIKDFGRAI